MGIFSGLFKSRDKPQNRKRKINRRLARREKLCHTIRV